MNRTSAIAALAIAVVVGLVFGLWPELDLKLAAVFFDARNGGFWRAADPSYTQARDVTIWIVALIAVLSVVVPIVRVVIHPQRSRRPARRAVTLVLVSLALGPGLLTNLVLKEHWGRPRPIDVERFGGDEHFRPWWDPRGDCPKNCSFVSGDVSGGFWTMAPAAVVAPQWRALAYGAALLFGLGVGVLRMAAGAHFFTDVVFAGVFMFFVIWLTHGWLFHWRKRDKPEQ